MKRRSLAWVIIAASVPLGGAIGCAGGTAKEEREPWTQKRWAEAIREDEQRKRPEKPEAVSLVLERIREFMDVMTGKTPFNAAKALFDPANPEGRRRAVVYLANRVYGRAEPYTNYYENMARTDDEPLVRSAALRALNRARDERMTDLFASSLDAREAAVRLEAAKALANVPDAEAVPKLIRRMQDPEENLDVRIAAADALRNYRTAEVAQALVAMLRGQFSVAWQARQSLKLMTGQDFRYDRTAWLDYLSGAQRPFG